MGLRYKIDFSALMQICEMNYARLQPLVASMSSGQSLTLLAGRSLPSQFVLNVTEHAPYTTMLTLTGGEVAKGIPRLSLTLRLYHDVLIAEVVEVQGVTRLQARYDYPNGDMFQADEKQQWNAFLAEWLSHMQDHGRLAVTQPGSLAG